MAVGSSCTLNVCYVPGIAETISCQCDGFVNPFVLQSIHGCNASSASIVAWPATEPTLPASGVASYSSAASSPQRICCAAGSCHPFLLPVAPTPAAVVAEVRTPSRAWSHTARACTPHHLSLYQALPRCASPCACSHTFMLTSMCMHAVPLSTQHLPLCWSCRTLKSGTS